jgi:hypothetical protein
MHIQSVQILGLSQYGLTARHCRHSQMKRLVKPDTPLATLQPGLQRHVNAPKDPREHGMFHATPAKIIASGIVDVLWKPATLSVLTSAGGEAGLHSLGTNASSYDHQLGH